MSSLELDRGPGKLRYMVMGGIAAIFAVGILAATHGTRTVTPASATSRADASAAPAAAPGASPSSSAAPAGAADAATPTPTAAAGAEQTAPGSGSPSPVAAAPPPSAAEAPVSAPAATELASAAMPPAAGDAPVAAAPTSNVEAAAAPVAAAHPAERPRRAVRPPPPPALGALLPWWREAAGRDFGVEYVGQAASEQALVFRFSQNASAEAAARSIRVIDERGAATQGQWTQGQNPYVLVYRGVNPGRYTVRIEPTLASVAGTPLGSTLQGAIYVR